MAGFVKTLVNLYGDKEISSMIGRLRHRSGDMQTILADIGEIYAQNTRLRIDSQTDPQGRVWKYNAPSTQRLKKRGTKDKPPAIEGPNKRLVWEGTLRDRIHYRVGGNTVYIYSDVPYAFLMQYGAKKGELGTGRHRNRVFDIPWGDVPPRRFLGKNKVTNKKVLDRLKFYFETTTPVKRLPKWAR